MFRSVINPMKLNIWGFWSDIVIVEHLLLHVTVNTSKEETGKSLGPDDISLYKRIIPNTMV